MFGRLRPPPHSRTQHRADFCGSCHAMAKIGRSWSLATSYDIAFLYGIASALEDSPLQTRPCTALPWKQLQVREVSPSLGSWLASINILLLEAKFRDDLHDGEALRGRLGLKLVKGQGERAEQELKRSGFPPELIRELPNRQANSESLVEQSLEQLSLPSSQMLGEIFAHLAVLTNRPENVVPLRRLGQSVASAIYYKDAIDDQSTDRKRGRFNALEASRRTPLQAKSLLEREVRRAVSNLEALEIPRTTTLGATLAQLSPRSQAQRTPSLAQHLRDRKSQAGICDCCGPDLCCAMACGGCDPCCCCATCIEEKRKSSTTTFTKATPKPPQDLPCPACDHQMTCSQSSGVEYDECLNCLGLWLDKGELQQLARAEMLPHRLLHGRLDGSLSPLRPEGTRSCPRCAKVMSVMTVREVRLDFCADCQGLFLDHGELLRFLEHNENSQES